MKKITAVIADDDESVRRQLLSVLESDGEIEVLGQAENGLEAWRLIHRLQPDVVLTDLVMPKMDGMDLLQMLSRDAAMPGKPAVIVISAVGRDAVIRSAFRYGASYYIMKPYDAGMVCRHVHQAAGSRNEQNMKSPVFMRPVQVRGGRSLEEEASALLQRIGVPVHMKGYLYLRDAVVISVEQPSLLESVTKVLYPAVARMNQTAPSCVERAIRHAITAAWQRGGEERVREVLRCDTVFPKGRATNSELIALVSDRLRYEREHQPERWPGA
ncbi:MAG: sporulation transcription factor Spo0A [Lachnospiraceae bacterium]|jgi:two-component system response regulator (stage 0 sporulation protein A)